MAGDKSSEVINFIRGNEFEYNLMDLSDLQIESVINLYRKYNKDKNSGGSIDCSDTITGLKAIQREAKKATAALKEMESYPGTIKTTTLKDVNGNIVEEFKEYSLLTIELETIDSVPVVHYKGQEISKKRHVEFIWDTQTDEYVPSPKINIEYVEGSPGKPNIKSIDHKGWNPFEGDKP